MIVLIDNYDSFTFNLFHYLGGLGAEVVVHRNDKIAVDDVTAADPDAIVLSPGPCTPNEAGICLDLIAKACRSIPILGVCLGHQACGEIAAAAGRKAHHKAHRPRRIGLRTRDARHARHRGSACGQMQKSTAGKFHDVPQE